MVVVVGDVGRPERSLLREMGRWGGRESQLWIL